MWRTDSKIDPIISTKLFMTFYGTLPFSVGRTCDLLLVEYSKDDERVITCI